MLCGHVHTGQVGDGESGEDRGDEAGVVAGDVAARGDEDDGCQLDERAECFAESQFVKGQPEDGGAYRASREADTHADEELPDLVAAADVDPVAGRDGVEDHGPEDAADRVRQCSFPDQDAPQSVRGADVLQQGAYDGGSGDDEDHSDHRRHPQRDPEEGLPHP